MADLQPLDGQRPHRSLSGMDSNEVERLIKLIKKAKKTGKWDMPWDDLVLICKLQVPSDVPSPFEELNKREATISATKKILRKEGHGDLARELPSKPKL